VIEEEGFVDGLGGLVEAIVRFKAGRYKTVDS
jgi:hypothetical protein